MVREALTGWGRTAPTTADVVRPADAGSVASLLASPGARGAIARGLGRSYGDAAQNAGGTVVATPALDHMAWSDEAAGLLSAGGGTSLDTILRALVPRGWFIPVSPGTRSVTVGGAIAADVHGKNHHADGSFMSWVDRVTLATPVDSRCMHFLASIIESSDHIGDRAFKRRRQRADIVFDVQKVEPRHLGVRLQK